MKETPPYWYSSPVHHRGPGNYITAMKMYAGPLPQLGNSIVCLFPLVKLHFVLTELSGKQMQFKLQQGNHRGEWIGICLHKLGDLSVLFYPIIVMNAKVYQNDGALIENYGRETISWQLLELPRCIMYYFPLHRPYCNVEGILLWEGVPGFLQSQNRVIFNVKPTSNSYWWLSFVLATVYPFRDNRKVPQVSHSSVMEWDSAKSPTVV